MKLEKTSSRRLAELAKIENISPAEYLEKLVDRTYSDYLNSFDIDLTRLSELLQGTSAHSIIFRNTA